MVLSAVPSAVRSHLSPLVAESANKGRKDEYSATLRRTFFISQFNIVKKESLQFHPLTGIKVPFYKWPLLQLPSEAVKLTELKYSVSTFKYYQFEYVESFYSTRLWHPLLLSLFRSISQVNTDYVLSRIESDYPDLRANFAVQVKNFAPPTLFVELAKDHLIQPNVNHKDEDKICFFMGASLLRLLWLNRDKNQEFLTDLRVYGLLCGASDFELCSMYAVFPSADDNNDFYFVFDTSKKHLRFKIFEYNSFDDDQFFTREAKFELHGETSLKYPITSAESVELKDITEEIAALNDAIVLDGFYTEELIVKMPLPIDSDKRYCENIFKEGCININSLQVLEKLVQLVQAQKELLTDMLEDKSPIDPLYKYDLSHIIKSLSTNTGPSPKRTKIIQHSESEAATRTGRAIVSFLQIVRSTPITNENFIPHDEHADVDGKESTFICVKKEALKYELEVYEAIKDSACFPKCFGYVQLPESNEIELKLEEIVSNYRTNRLLKPVRHSESTVSVTASKMIVDLFGALITLHSAGFVHGDISPGNVGYNESKGIWQLFDFDNSRPIEEAAEGIGKFKSTKCFTSPQFLESGLYYPFDDFVGLQKTMKLLFGRADFNVDPEMKEIMRLFDKHKVIDVIELRRIYFKAVQVLWNRIRNPSDPSIVNAVIILKELIL